MSATHNVWYLASKFPRENLTGNFSKRLTPIGFAVTNQDLKLSEDSG